MQESTFPHTARRRLGQWLALLTVACVPAAAWADRDDHRHRHHHRGEAKQTYYDGACKVERKWKKDGRYEEKRKCRPEYGYPQAVYPQQYVTPVSPAIVIQPPAIVIQP